MRVVASVAALAVAVIANSRVCEDPIAMGELRVMQPDKFGARQCVDIAGRNGKGYVNTHKCDGGKDQQMIVCGDGSIRNQAGNYCLQRKGWFKWDIRSGNCDLDRNGGVARDQQFEKGDTKKFKDAGGIWQEAFQLRHKKTGKCLDVAGTNGKGNISLYWCDGREDQYFYFRNRGKVVGTGRLVNKKSQQCLDVWGRDGTGNVASYPCDKGNDQNWTLYENGELVNEESGHCLDPSGLKLFNGQNLRTNPCEGTTEQMWRIDDFHDSGFFPLISRKDSKKCLDLRREDANKRNAIMWTCSWQEDQYWRWDDGNSVWTKPTGDWVLVGCNESGDLRKTVAYSVEYSGSMNVGLMGGLAKSISAGLSFAGGLGSAAAAGLGGAVGTAVTGGVGGGAMAAKTANLGLGAQVAGSATAAVSGMIGAAFSASYKQSERMQTDCSFYSDGMPWQGGCMWQFRVKSFMDGVPLKWNSFMTKCSKGPEAPKCMPFSVCDNDECSMCRYDEMVNASEEPPTPETYTKWTAQTSERSTVEVTSGAPGGSSPGKDDDYVFWHLRRRLEQLEA